jgi:hypothetical protein
MQVFDLTQTQEHIQVKRTTKWRDITTVGIANPSEVLHELVERETTVCCVVMLK